MVAPHAGSSGDAPTHRIWLLPQLEGHLEPIAVESGHVAVHLSISAIENARAGEYLSWLELLALCIIRGQN